ncbi:hypothetical protein [Flammeovirga kamogawensis]|uniref:Ig-like domain-containing protein n=1 Tax=Flammeovirga kamogawensis TaxID=373891 RepID=A0ABX8GUY0_9BACT|nr:hypothetical protein [Flammeovirga kamogawensis]MBB6459915.1 hypothetical protein [Flammeovirga kamogawensis]QWG07032.1 hypothetical protein KM029_17280 [Flammeovirga kamogawensis]TRX68853.1 hypothetical protein EO216_12265 [Flammeovirga kamogawensis]
MRLLLIAALILSYSFSINAQNQLDRTRIIFKSGKYSNSTSINVEIHGVGITEMMANGNESFTGSRWIKFQKLFHYTLSSGDGVKTVYFKFKDADGNESSILKKKIILDTTPPQNTKVEIDVPSKYFTDQKSLKVGVILTAKDAKYYQLGNTSAFHGSKWRLIQDDYVEWDLEAGDDGTRRVYARYRDQAGNITPVIHDEIIVDRTAPFGSKLTINGGEKITNRQDRKVELDIFCRQADSMIVSQDPQFIEQKWEKYSIKKSINLTDGDGLKKVYVKFKDLAGNITPTTTSTINIDTQAPKNIELQIDNGAESTTNINKLVTLQIKNDGAKLMMVSNSSSFSGGHWKQADTSVIDWKLKGETDGIKHVYIKFKDDAGNVSRPIRASIELKRGF